MSANGDHVLSSIVKCCRRFFHYLCSNHKPCANMHVHSFLRLLGLSLISIVTAAPSLKRDVQVSNALPSKWSSLGCYTDSTSARGLRLDGFAANDMTEGKCISYCDQRGYSYAAVEYGQECWCDYLVRSPSTQTPASDCNFACAGSSGEACGGSSRMNVFTNGDAAPVENPGVNGFHSLSCYTDSDKARTLSTYLPVSDGIVFVRGCIEQCQQRGFTYCGVEYGKQCFGGYGILNNAQPADPTTCDMPCSGNRTEKCGGSSRINLYQIDGQSSCAGPSGNSGLITNGGFESGLSPWAVKNNLGQTTSSVVNSNSYAGCSAFQMQTQPNSYTSQYQFSQTFSSPLVQGKQYALTFYQGRRSASSSDGDTTDPVIAVSSGSQRFLQGNACSGSQCSLQGSDGSVYQKVSVTFTASGSQQTSIAWTVTYQSQGVFAPVLFDEISVIAA